MNIRYVAQPPDANCCAQSCCAMLAGISLEAACEEFGHSHSSYTWEVVRFLRNHGFECPDRLKPVGKKHLPGLCILKLRLGELSMGHVVVYNNGVVFDPSVGLLRLDDYAKMAFSYGTPRITSYLPISEGR